MASIQALETLKNYWGFDAFRPIQETVVERVLEDKHTFALLPTGGGKSICFQVPGLVKEGICIVISPLLSLMRDQVSRLKEKGIKAEYLHSGLNGKQIDIVLDNCIFGNTKFLYLSPERIQSILVRERLQQMNVNLIAVDEAHCISQWGHDFRPSYQKINHLIEMHPNAPRIALTGTATPKVVEDICEQLDIPKEGLIKDKFDRENLHFQSYNTENKPNALVHYCKKIEGSGIIYVRSRKLTEQYAKELQKHYINAEYYHAGLSPEDRNKVENDWKSGKLQWVVATNAFGMGIDKPDVRAVVHMDLPSNLEEYIQESGRAGRDGNVSDAVILWNKEDILFQEAMLDYRFPSKQEIGHIYQKLANYFQVATGIAEGKGFPFNIYAFSNKLDLEPLKVFNAIKILEREGYFFLSDPQLHSSKIQVVANQYEVQKVVDSDGKQSKLLQHLLRSFTGLFIDKTKIDEESIGKQLGWTPQDVSYFLTKLSKRNILFYAKKEYLPVLIYLHDRVPVSHLDISANNLSVRRAVAQKQLRAIVEFATNEEECRTNIALRYFGEIPEKNCMHCDNCLRDTKNEGVRKFILKALKNGSATTKDITLSAPFSQQIVIQEIRIMLEDKIIQRNGNQLTLQ